MKRKKKIGRIIHRVHGPDYNIEKAKEIKGEMKQEEVEKLVQELTDKYYSNYYHQNEEGFYYKVPESQAKKYDKFYLWFLSDVQVGNVDCDWPKFLRYCSWAYKTSNVLIVLGGDLQDNNIPEHIPQAMFRQMKQPREQRRLLKEALMPLRSKIICSLVGNHELRTFYKTGEDPTEILSNELGIPFRGFGGYLTIDIGQQKYITAIHHGASASRTNMWVDSERLRKIYPAAELLICGHSHFMGDKRNRVRLPDPEGKKPFIMKDIVYVRSGSFQNYGGYAEANIMEPTKTGQSLIKLYSKYHLIDVSTSDKIGSGAQFK